MPGTLKGQKKAEVHEVFANRLTELRDAAAKAVNSFQGKDHRVWNVPTGLSTALLDIANLHLPAFDRTPINEQYVELTAKTETAGTTGDIISLKLQVDYNAAEERAFRTRHMTMSRAFCMGHGRRYGQAYGNLWNAQRGVEGVIAAYQAAGGVS